ncbi:unnamed protein product [Phytophthora lilii]|uniref:Unnamed protein product n=1 Tax=Phytophthora lilii TaxID=2077276 RepID=A0A9W6TJ07_9STRA|nr:unnamed protein product [Phytophthora lilii]
MLSVRHEFEHRRPKVSSDADQRLILVTGWGSFARPVASGGLARVSAGINLVPAADFASHAWQPTRSIGRVRLLGGGSTRGVSAGRRFAWLAMSRLAFADANECAHCSPARLVETDSAAETVDLENLLPTELDTPPRSQRPRLATRSLFLPLDDRAEIQELVSADHASTFGLISSYHTLYMHSRCRTHSSGRAVPLTHSSVHWSAEAEL